MSDARSDKQKAEDAEKTLKYLADVRQPFEATIDSITTYVNHSRRKISDKDGTKGNRTGSEVYDGSALSSLNLLVDGMVGYLCSRNLRWFRFAIPAKYYTRGGTSMRLDENPEVRTWLQECEDVQYSAFARSNYYDIITEFVRDGASIGTAHLVAEEELATGKIAFTVPHFKECFISENQHGKVDTNYRVYKMTLRQMVDRWGMELLSSLDKDFQSNYSKNFYSEREIIHAVYPRSDYDQSRSDSKSKAIASLWVMREPCALIEEKGYDSMPNVTWRWRKNNDEWYGRSPAWDAYVDIMLANQQARTNLIAGHKMVEPAMVGPSDLRGQVNVGPKGWTWIDGDLEARMPRPLITGIQLPYGIEQLQRTEKSIRDYFATDFFLALTMAAENKVDLTATQVIGMMGERAAILGTRVGQLQSEALDPIHDRVFDIESRSGRIPPPPDILLEMTQGKIEIEYLGPLAQAQIYGSKSRSNQAFISSIVQLAPIVPDITDRVNWDKLVDETAQSTGFSMDCLNSDEDVAAMRQQRAQQQAQQQQIENLPGIAKAARFGGIKPEAGSPVDQMLNPEGQEGAA